MRKLLLAGACAFALLPLGVAPARAATSNLQATIWPFDTCPSVDIPQYNGTLLVNNLGQLCTNSSGGGGISVSSKQVANNTTSVAIDASAGTLYGVTVFNNSATIAYLKLYNTAQGSVTCGSGTPVQRIMIPASTSGAGAVIPFPVGIAYGTAITSCVTTGYADADTTAPAASAYMIEFYYK